MTAILGVSAFYHDSAAALLVDGRIVAAAQEERFTRVKHDDGFPVKAIEYCLEEAGLTPDQLDYIGFYEKPLLKFERLLETYLAYAPAGFSSFVQSMPLWLRKKLYLPRVMNRHLGGAYKRRYVFPEHHESHAASAFFPSPFEEATVLTVDGVGEWATVTFGCGSGNRITLTHELRFPHSLGLLYSAFTYFCGFRVNSGEYKLMGLAPYGTPRYVDTIMERVVDLKNDGSFRLNMSYFNYCQGLTMTSRKFEELFGGKPRKPDSELTQREMDLAASVQRVTEEIMLRMARHVHAETGMKNLCLAGGVALNCVSNGRIVREGPFENIWIQPASGDAGGALGVSLLVWHQLLDNPRKTEQQDSQQGSFLGPHFRDPQVREFLERVACTYHHLSDQDELLETVASLLEQGKVVGWMQGRMEFGPRALGARSIIGDARHQSMQSIMNVKIKFRESFRPFAPSVLEERAQDYFTMGECDSSPYMLLVAPVNPQKCIDLDGESDDLQGLSKLKAKRSEVPAVTHVDYSARVQTVDRMRSTRYWGLLKKFEARTGCPVIINTSFNVRGEPIVCTPEDAYACFMGTNMDVLVMENFLLHKEEQPDVGPGDREEYLARFELD